MKATFSSLPHIPNPLVGTEIVPAVSASLNVIITPNDILGFVSSSKSLIVATASYALNGGSSTIDTSSFVTNNQTSSMSVLSASYAETASYALNGGGSSPSPTPTTLTYSSTLTVDSSLVTIGRVAMTDAMTVAAPTNPSDGAKLELWITATGGSQTLTLDSAIYISSNAMAGPYTLTSGGLYILVLQYDGTDHGGAWRAVSLTGAY